MSQFEDQSSLRWRKSARSTANSSNCVEIADAGQVIKVRDSKNPTGPHFAFSRREITDFAARIKRGDHDL